MRYNDIKPTLSEEVLDEVKMSPSTLMKFANSPEAEGMLLGIEFEMGVPNAQTEDDGYGEYDYDQNQSAYSIDEIINFFRNGEHSSMGRSEADRLSSQMWEQFLDWQSGQIYENIDDNELNSRIRSRLEDDYTVDDYIEAAREELGDDAPDSDVEGRAEELRDDAITEIITVGDGRDYQYAYDSAREELEEEMRDDSDYDQEAWLNDIGINDMQDAEREWSLDWPHMNYSGGGDVSVDDVADDFAQAMGVAKVITSTGYHGARRDGVSWIIEPDSSIDADDGDGGLEFVSPPMPIKDGLEMIKKFKAWASSYGCYTNDSTGLHMNISVPDMTVDKLDYVKLALFLGDEYVLKEFDRTYNTYAKSAMKIVKEKIQQSPENATALLAKMKEHLNTAASKLVHTGITNKYTSINTKENYVEFRGPGGDYLDKDPLELINTALRLAMSLRIATDESAYKQEYAKKLYKLIGPKDGDWTDPNNSVALFSRYALGEIDKNELVNNVRQAQTARREKKGDKDLQYWVMNRDESGGKQMVYARSETDAIILGGKQMGLDREESIRQLKAELVYRQDMPMPSTVPEKWQYWVKETLPNVSGDVLASIRQKLADGGQEYELEPLANNWLLRQVDNELRSRQDAGDTGEEPASTPTTSREVFDSLSQSWQTWLGDVGTHANETLENMLRTIEAGTGDVERMTPEQRNLITTTIHQELRRRQQPAQDTAMTGSLPVGWQQILSNVAIITDENLQRYIGYMPNISQDLLSPEQKEYISGILNVELQRRNRNNTLAANAGSAENAVRASLPQSHREFLDDLANKSDMGLINILRNNNVYQGVSEQAAAYFRVQLRHELRRRGINPDSEPGDIVAPGLGEREPQQDPAAQQMSEWDIRDSQSRVVANIEAGSAQSALDEYMNAYEVEDITGYTAVPTQQAAAIQQQAEVNESIDLIRKLAGLK